MKQLTKELLTEMVYANYKKIFESNINGMKERLLDSIKESRDNCAELMVKLVVAYGTEIMNECNQVISETLYDILYTE